MARTDYHRRWFQLGRTYVRGKLRAIKPPARLRVKSLLYKDNVTNLSGPIVGGSSKHPSVMSRLSQAMRYLGKGRAGPAARSSGRIGMARIPIRGGCLNMI